MPESKRPLKVFLCHAHADRDTVRALYMRLTSDGVDAWLDKEKLLPGQDWELEIRKAVGEADVVVVCLSKQFNQRGFRQKEVRIALDTAMEQPEGEIFIIPARLEECENLSSLKKWHWVNLFENDGYEKLMSALRVRAEKLGINLSSKRNWLPRINMRYSAPRKFEEVKRPEELEKKVVEIKRENLESDAILGLDNILPQSDDFSNSWTGNESGTQENIVNTTFSNLQATSLNDDWDYKKGLLEIILTLKKCAGYFFNLRSTESTNNRFPWLTKFQELFSNLNPKDEQIKGPAILEGIVSRGTNLEMLASAVTLGESKKLRRAIALPLVTITFVITILRTQLFSMPEGIPSELGHAVAIVQAIPAGSSVLVAMDYEPARVGEMEAAAAPLFDNMLLLKHPRLTFIASNESGAMLAERFMSGPMDVHNYESQVTYLNLGYLSGGQTGVRAFAQNPSLVAPLDINSQPAWTLQPLQGVVTLDQFAAIILITDNADAARTWVEQTEGARGVIPLLVVSSAQAAPMIQPYYDSGQVNGVISGLYGGALVEFHYNASRPGTARAYWDAYNIGMFLATFLILSGGLLNLVMGMRERSTLREGN